MRNRAVFLRAAFRGTWFLAGAALLVAGVMAAIYLPRLGARPTAPAVPIGNEQVEFVTIILAAATTILAALAIVLAIAGAIGYAQIKQAAQASASEAARDVTRELVPREVESVMQTLRGGDSGDEIARAAGKSNDDAPG